jgi:PST family polysaccharide transporter
MSAKAPSLGIVTARGVFWTGGGQIVRQVIQVLTSIALARLLVPDDFGLLGMALVFTGFAQLFLDFGIGMAIIQAREIKPKALSSCFWTNLGITLTTVLVLILASPLIAAFYNRSDLMLVVIALALSLLVSGSGVVSSALLSRNMQFDRVAKAQVIGTVVGATAAVYCAWIGLGVWSLVVQQLAGFSAVTALVMLYARWRPRLEYSWGAISEMISFGARVFGSGVLNFAQRNSDSMLIGKFLGSGPLGYYSLAYQLMLYPLGQVSGVIVRVLFPTLSRLQGDMERFRSAYLKAVSAIALVTFPMMAGLFAVSEDFVHVVFGEKWLPMLPVLRILCWVGMAQSIGTTVGLIYLSLGRVKLLFRMNLLFTPLILVSFVAGLSWGIEGVATAYAGITFSLLYVTLGVAFRLSAISFREFHEVLIRPFGSSIFMLACVSALSYGLIHWSGSPAMLRLALCIVIGVLSYAGATLALNTQQCLELLRLAREAISRRG